MNHFSIQQIGVIHSPFKQKFGVPRQPGLVPDLVSTIEMMPEFGTLEAFKGIEQFSHLWLLFLFHKNLEAGWRPTIRPPRLGGKTKMGVFATRCTFRPNGIGQSVVAFSRVYQKNGRVFVDVKGADLMDGTPIIDIKPYIQYSDSIASATSGFAQEKPPAKLGVLFSPEAEIKLREIETDIANLKTIIEQTLAADPRPAYRQTPKDDHRYGIALFDLNIKWEVRNGNAIVIDIGRAHELNNADQWLKKE